MGSLGGSLGRPWEPWGSLRGPCGRAGRSLRVPWGPWEVAGSVLGGPVGVFKRSWQLWKSLKNHWFFLCFRARGCPGGSLGKRWGAWGAPQAIGEAPRGSLGGPREVGGLKARILRGFVITWGGPWGAFGRPGGGPKKLRASLSRIKELVVMGPGPPLSYKLKLIAQRKIDRSDADPSLPHSNTPLGHWPGEYNGECTVYDI